MRNDAKKGSNGVFSMRSLSGYLKIVSSGASSVASTVRSAGASISASIADDGPPSDQVHWAGFENLECEDGTIREVLLLAYRSGFEVWDVEEADNVHQLASRQDGPVSFMQILKRPVTSKKCKDRFADFRPLLVVVGDAYGTADVYNQGTGVGSFQEQGSETTVQFYSLRINSYVNAVKFRAPVYSIRCGPRVVAVCQASQIHCFDAATLERDYTFLTYPIVSGSSGSGGIGYGPLAVGTRWLAYSGNWVIVDRSGRINPQPPDSMISSSAVSGSLVAHYAKESGKQLASGLATLGDLGYKTLSRYCSELLPDRNYFRQGSWKCNANGTSNNGVVDMENAGMVIVRDIVSRSVIVQFRAHSSPICALCFDPSGTLLVTASTCGHNVNVFHITPPRGCLSMSDAAGSCTHLYKLQRGFTNAVIQDISFSFDSRYVSISSSKGTSHLFALSSHGGMQVSQPYDTTNITNNGLSSRTKSSTQCSYGSSSCKVNKNTLPITLSAITRIKNGGSGWKGTVTDAAAAAAGRVNLPCGAISSTFHACKKADVRSGLGSVKTKYYMLVFSPAGSLMQYVLQHTFDGDNPGYIVECGSSFNTQDIENNLVAEALQKWDLCHKRNRRVSGRNLDAYGENSVEDNLKFVGNGRKKGINVFTTAGNKKNCMESNAEEGCHMYISEVELHMHPARMPLWAKPEINFQVMMDAFTTIESSNTNGEIVIERISTRTIVARSKDLIPASDYPQLPRFQHSRSDISEKKTNEPFLSRRSGLSDVGKLTSRSSSNIDCFPDVSATPKLSNGNTGNEWDSHPAAIQRTLGTINARGSLNVIPIEPVDKVMVPTLKTRLVHANNIDSPKMENLFVDGDNDID